MCAGDARAVQTSTRVLSLEILAQAASIQVVSIIHRIKVRKIEVANFNTSVEYPSRPAGAAPVYVRDSGWFAL